MLPQVNLDQTERAYIALRVLTMMFGFAYVGAYLFAIDVGVFGRNGVVLVGIGLSMSIMALEPRLSERYWFSTLIVALSSFRAINLGKVTYDEYVNDGLWKGPALATWMWTIATICLIGWIVAVSEREELKRNGLDPGQ